jgi:hypothetical protein
LCGEGASPHRRQRSVWRFTRIPLNSGDKRRLWALLVCGQSSSENGPDPCRGVRDESLTCSLREVIMPGQGFSRVSPYTAPTPLGRGRSAGEPGGVGATRRVLRVPPPAGRGRAPSPVSSPEAIPTTVPCPGEPGDTPRSPPMLRWVGTITRTDMGVQQNLNLADSQPGTQCTHGCVRANGGTPPPGPSPARRYPVESRVSTFDAGSCSILCERASACSEPRGYPVEGYFWDVLNNKIK